jgi:putative ATPase
MAAGQERTLFDGFNPAGPADVPLAERLRPRTLEDFSGQPRMTDPTAPFSCMVRSGRMRSCILWGPPGCGKTTLVRLAADESGRRLLELNAADAKAADLREAMEQGAAAALRGEMPPILFIDEIYHLNRTQQDLLLPAVEKGSVALMGTTVENPWHCLAPSLMSRCILFEMEELPKEALMKVLRRGAGIMKTELGVLADEAILEAILDKCAGDARQGLTLLELSCETAKRRNVAVLDIEVLKVVAPRGFLRHDRAGDQHYHVKSAWIKAMRGSDPDAALYWLARLMEGGETEDALGRRLVIFAAEDIGLADPQALPIAEAAAAAACRTGYPEARLILGQAVAYLALAPKSNSAYMAVNRALEVVKSGNCQPVPEHLIPHSTRYLYPHDYPGHFVNQPYMNVPERFLEFRDPAGAETGMIERWRRRRPDLAKEQPPLQDPEEGLSRD